MADAIEIELDKPALKELERRMTTIDLRVAQRLTRNGLRAAARATRAAFKAASPSRRLKTKYRLGKTSVFRVTKKGGRLPRANGGFGSISIGVPSLQHTPPDKNKRAYFVAYSYEYGNPGVSAQAQRMDRRRERARGPFLARTVEAKRNEIVNAFTAEMSKDL